MVNARSTTAKMGFGIFLETHDRFGKFLSLSEVNEELALLGREGIHQRSITHYHNMWKAGIHSPDGYLTINRFDLLYPMTA